MARTPFVYAIASIYEEVGNPSGALETMARVSPGTLAIRHNPRTWYERARLAEELGDRASAIENYERYLVVRKGAEPSFQAEVAAVETELARLRSTE